MASRLKHVDPTRPRGPLTRAYAALANTHLGRFLSVHFMWKVDPYLMRATGGRIGMGLVLPTALLETRGAKSGEVRRNAVIYFHEAERRRLWALADRVFAPYRREAARTGRTIPIVQLMPADARHDP